MTLYYIHIYLKCVTIQNGNRYDPLRCETLIEGRSEERKRETEGEKPAFL